MYKDMNKTKKQLIAELNELRESVEGRNLFADLADGRALRMDEYIQLLPVIGETINSGVVLQSFKGSILYTNKTARDILGMGDEDLLGRTSIDPVWEMILEDGTPVPGDEHPAMITIKTGEPTKNAVRGLYSKDDPKARWIIINSEAVQGSVMGEKWGVLSSFVDITEIKSMEETLKVSETNYRELVESTDDLVIRVDGDGRFTFVNKSSEKILGLSPNQCVGSKAAEFIHPEDASSSQMWFLNCINDKVAAASIENRQTNRKTGEVFDMHWKCSFHYDESGEFKDGTAIARDISDRKRMEKAVHTSEEQLAEIFDKAPIGIALTSSPDFRFIKVSDNLCKLFGYTREELLSMRIQDVTHPEDVGPNVEIGKKIVSGELDFAKFEKRYLGKNGESIWANLTTSLIRDAEGVPLYFVSMIEDITDHKKLELELRESEDRFYKAFRDSPVMMAISSVEDGAIVDVNEMFVKVTGYSREEVLNRTSVELGLFKSDTREAIMEKLLGDGAVRGFEMSIRTRSGEERQLLFSADITTIGGTAELLSTALDVTDLKATERELTRQNELSTLFMESMPNFVVLLNFDQTILASNRIAQELGGTAGQKCYEMWGLTEQCPWCLVSELQKTGKVQNAIVEINGRTCDTFWVPVEENLYIHYGFDITGKVKAEEDRLNFERQLLDSQKVESLGVLAGGIAHDFNNLLMGIIGNINMAQMDLPPGSPVGKYLKRAEMAAQKSADLTNQMLAYSGKGKFLIKPLDMSEVVSEMAHLLETTIASDASLKLHLAKDLPAVEADPGQVSQIVMNLITNASDALSGKLGIITLVTELVTCDAQYLSRYPLSDNLKPGSYVSLKVSDTGGGMRHEVMGRIFDPFFSTKERGRGLGLSAVIGIVRGHRGAIRVQSQVGEGTTFTVLFPVSGKPLEKKIEKSSSTDGFSGEGTVLVVDDETAVREIAAAILKNFGFRVLHASNGSEALDLYQEHITDISLVLMDITMPVMGGLEALRNLRQIAPDIKVILSSGYSEKESLKTLSEEKLADFIQKPYLASDLIAKIREVMEKNGSDS